MRASLARYAFDERRFAMLSARVGDGTLDPSANRLSEAPEQLVEPPLDLRPGSEVRASAQARLETLGRAAIAAGRAAVLVLNGGMATRFGGGAKGVVPVVEGRADVSFLAVKLAQVRTLAAELGARVPVVLMHSFATVDASREHLADIDWAHLPEPDRYEFEQSIMPRVLPDGTPLATLSEAADLEDTALYSAPGHGDTLGRLRESGTLAALRARGVEHVLVSNVDNLGASLDPMVLGAHLEATESGAGISVEVVRRVPGDAGGCIARLPGGRPAIIEAFRLPVGTDLAHYPHFNTNTLWLALDAVDRELELTWFAVRKSIAWPDPRRADRDGNLEVVQFETLIGQATELVASAWLEVDRATRFCPIKTRDDVPAQAAVLRAFARAAGLAS